ncbi:hypothetical protein FHT38_001008 [Mitsuaria sp. BK041]|nr:hypothetical protein [Mitsuaria sp. BK041]
MHHGVHFLRGEVNVGLAVVGHQESVPIPVTLNRAFDLPHQRMALGACVLEVFDNRILVFPETQKPFGVSKKLKAQEYCKVA